MHRTGVVKKKLSDPNRAALDAAIASMRATAEDQARLIREAAERQAEAVLANAESRIAEIEADWAIATSSGKPSHLLNARGVAELLGVSTGVVYKLLNQGALPTVQVLTRRYIPREAVEEFASTFAKGGRLLVGDEGSVA